MREEHEMMPALEENSSAPVELPKRRGRRRRFAIYFVLLLVPVAIIAIPNFVKARGTACKNACINNLRQIDGAKEQWALENKAEAGASIGTNSIGQYIKGGWPACPGGGIYTPEPIGQAPKCSMGHTL